MEKPNLNISLSSSLQAMRGAVARSMNPDIMWRVVIASFLCGAIAIGVFAYLTYSWAAKVEVAITPTTRDHDEFSIEELRGVIKVYQAKEETYNTLLRVHPTPPDYARGKGIMPIPVPALPTGVPEVGTSTTLGTGTPSVLR
jgi:hypothetical protein